MVYFIMLFQSSISVQDLLTVISWKIGIPLNSHTHVAVICHAKAKDKKITKNMLK